MPPRRFKSLTSPDFFSRDLALSGRAVDVGSTPRSPEGSKVDVVVGSPVGVDVVSDPVGVPVG